VVDDSYQLFVAEQTTMMTTLMRTPHQQTSAAVADAGDSHS